MRKPHPSLTLLIAAFLAYGLLIPQLGFYWDDLPMSWIRYQLGTDAMTRYFSTNRPVWALLYQGTTRLLPQIPIYWQVFALFWRWLGAVTVWAIVRRLWPDREKFAFLLSLIFLLYPGFNQQWGSYLFSHFFIVLFFFLFSFYLMLYGRTIPALIFSALNLWMLEYFFVLELIRPFVIWISLRRIPASPRERWMRTFKLWIPYLTVFILAVLSRMFVFNNQIYGFDLKEELVTTPVETIGWLIHNALLSLWTVTITAWEMVFHFPHPAIDGPRTTMFYLFVVIGTGAITLFGLYIGNQIEERKVAESLQAIALGLVMLVLGGPPFWLTNVPVTLGFPANRATLAFILGVSFVCSGVLELFPLKIRSALVIILVSLAAGRQFLWSNEFRRDWIEQKSMFWQMIWRAPGLNKNTLVLMNEELAFYADNSLGAALNWIYAPDNHSEHVDYLLLFPRNRVAGSLPSLEPNQPVLYDFLAGQFEGNTSQAVVYQYAPPGCLRLLDPGIDSINKLIPEDTLLRHAALISSAAQITRDPRARMPDIYGPEPPHGWCYYFEKADLARQFGDWTQVAALGDRAFKLDDYPNDPVERFVFIEGYAHTGEWEKAVELSIASYQVSKEFVAPLLCKLWDGIEKETIRSPGQIASLEKIRGKFRCLHQ